MVNSTQRLSQPTKHKRQQPQIRIRDQAQLAQAKKSKKALSGLSGTLLGGEPVRKVKKTPVGASKGQHRPPSPQFNTSMTMDRSTDQALPPKPKKKKAGKTTQGAFSLRQVNSSSLTDLQSVEEFRHFLLRNDSQFIEYVNSSLLLSIFDSHLMREGMISTMAQVLGSG